MPIENWSHRVQSEFACFMLGALIGSGMSREVYEHPFDPTKVIKVENSAKHFQNVKEWEIWQQFKDCPDVARWLAPCHFISDSGTFLIMDKVRDLPENKKIDKLPFFITDRKRDNLGMIGNRVVARDYALSIITLQTRLTKWKQNDQRE